MREVIQCLAEWVHSVPSDERAHLVLKALVEESLKKADFDEEKRRFTNKEVVAAIGETTNEPANKYVSWNKKVLPYWEARKDRVIKIAREKGIKLYPELGYFIPENKGRGNESLYWIKAEPLPLDDETEIRANLTQKNDCKVISYELAESGEVKPAWIVKWLLKTGQIRLSIWHIWALILTLLTIGGIAVIIALLQWIILTIPKPVTTRELTGFASIFIIPYCAWILIIRPWFDLFDQRIVKASELLVSMNEKSAQIELFRDGDLRMIRLVRYTAPCPICGSTIHLDKGEPDYPRRLVGRCYESPKEHVFSFDRVTRRGVTLRGSELKQ